MGYLGLEPRAYRLKAEYSTIELATPFIKRKEQNLKTKTNLCLSFIKAYIIKILNTRPYFNYSYSKIKCWAFGVDKLVALLVFLSKKEKELAKRYGLRS